MNNDYFTKQLITCIGNKRKLLPQILSSINFVKKRLGKDSLRTFDAFSGSGIVSRLLKEHSSYLAVNDMEYYAYLISKCFLSNGNLIDMKSLNEMVKELNMGVLHAPYPTGFIRELYAPEDENNITKDDRVFYTIDNAIRLDNYRRLIEGSGFFNLLIGPLLSKASIHTNTSGVFKGFYKDKDTNIGKYGGKGENALKRIKGCITLEQPVLSRSECLCDIFRGDTNIIAPQLNNVDLTYLDPPYNQHPYGSNYFMLNLVAEYERPKDISDVSGIPEDWNRSDYNVREFFRIEFTNLLNSLDSKFILVSFNTEGFVEIDELRAWLNLRGKVYETEVDYNTFRGSRNLKNRSLKVKEYLFLLERN